MKILIDNGHGEDTPGKCSPDGKFREYLYAREIAEQIVNELRSKGYDAERIVKEATDVPLSERARRVNEWCGRLGASNVLLVSVHVNAAANGEWKTAGGWCAYTSPGKTKADELATDLYNAAQTALADYIDSFPTRKKLGEYDSKQRPIRTDYSDGDPDYEAQFYVLTKTKCAAVLTESMFQDNKSDIDFLTSSEGRNAIVALHVNGIETYVKRHFAK